MADKVVYLGIFLDPQQREKLLRVVPPSYRNRSADHITLLYAPNDEQVAKFKPLVGKRMVITLTHVYNEATQAIRGRGRSFLPTPALLLE